MQNNKKIVAVTATVSTSDIMNLLIKSYVEKIHEWESEMKCKAKCGRISFRFDAEVSVLVT